MKVSARKTRGGDGWAEGEEEGVPGGGVLAQEMAAARAWLSAGMGWISTRGRSEGARCEEVSCKQSGCAFQSNVGGGW